MSKERDERDPRKILSRAVLNVPRDHVRSSKRKAAASFGARPVAEDDRQNGVVSFLRVKADLHQQLLSDLDRRNLINADEEQLAEIVEDFVVQALSGQNLALNEGERRQMVDDLLEETLGVGPSATAFSIASRPRSAARR